MYFKFKLQSVHFFYIVIVINTFKSNFYNYAWAHECTLTISIDKLNITHKHLLILIDTNKNKLKITNTHEPEA